MLQWHHQAVKPLDDIQSELDFFHELGVRIRERLRGSTDERDRPLLDLTWDYPRDEHGEVDAEAVLREINGHHLTGERAGQLLDKFADMRADGSTSGGCWIYTGVFAGGVNRSAEPGARPGAGRGGAGVGLGLADEPPDPLQPRLRRPAGPTLERAQEVRLVGRGARRSGSARTSPTSRSTATRRSAPTRTSAGPAAIAGDDPFIMQADGKGWLFAPKGMVDGPLPTHYEAQESPVTNALYAQQSNPSRLIFPRKDNLWSPSGDGPGHGRLPLRLHDVPADRAPHGGRDEPLAALPVRAPAGDVLRGLPGARRANAASSTADWATLVSARSAIEARVLVTDRMTPLTINGHTVHQIGLPYHWGVGKDAVVEGDGANDLLGVVLDPNVQIQESKVGSCDIRPGRRPHGRGAAAPGRRVPVAGGHHRRDRLGARRPGAGRDGATPCGHPDHRMTRAEEGTDGYLERQLSGPTDPAPDAGWTRRTQPQGVLHRHLDLHRLQGLRGGVQGVERRPARRAGALGQLLRQHRRPRSEHLAARRVRRADRRPDQRGPRVGPAPGRAGHAGRRCAAEPAPAPTAAAPAGYGTLPAPVDGHGPDLRDMLSETVAVEDGGVVPGTTVDGTPMVGALPEFRWLMASDVCKHCTHAGCLDVCPTGALFRSEHGTVVVQPTSATGAATASAPARSASSSGAPTAAPPSGATATCPTWASPRSAPSATTGSSTTRCPRARRPAPRRRSSSATTTTWSPRRGNGWRSCTSRASPRRGSTAPTRTTASAAPGRSSCCSTSPRSTGSRPTRSCATSRLPEMFRAAGYAGLGMLGAAAVAFLGRRG